MPEPGITREQIIEALKQVRDPELPINIVDLGLIYDVAISDDGAVKIRMTLTTPNCPVAGALPAEAQRAAQTVSGVTDVAIDLTFDPPWSPEELTADGRAILELSGIDLSGPKRPAMIPRTRLTRGGN